MPSSLELPHPAPLSESGLVSPRTSSHPFFASGALRDAPFLFLSCWLAQVAPLLWRPPGSPLRPLPLVSDSHARQVLTVLIVSAPWSNLSVTFWAPAKCGPVPQPDSLSAPLQPPSSAGDTTFHLRLRSKHGLFHTLPATPAPLQEPSSRLLGPCSLTHGHSSRGHRPAAGTSLCTRPFPSWPRSSLSQSPGHYFGFCSQSQA